jgi:uncharacterized protein with PIN domain
MAKQPAKTRTRTECPNCKGILFQGPFQRGHFEGGVFIVDEEVYQCRTCHTEYSGADLLRVVPLIEVESAG